MLERPALTAVKSWTPTSTDPWNHHRPGSLEFITAVPRGLVDAGEVVFFTFIIGGVFMVLRQRGNHRGSP